jgi:predicted nucleic acid-binding protein
MVYLDTSVVVALLVREPRSADVQTWFAGLEGMPVGSDWLLSEFASAVAIKVRRGELTEANAKLVHKEFDLLSASGLRLIPVSRAAFREAARLAKQHRHGLRAADALHLAAAMEAGANSVATLDGVMASNAKRLKLKVAAI